MVFLFVFGGCGFSICIWGLWFFYLYLGVVVFLFVFGGCGFSKKKLLLLFILFYLLTVELKSKTTTSIGGKTYFAEYSQNGIKKIKSK